MDFWCYFLGLDYLVSTIGFIANLLYFKNVVMNKFYDGYWRVASFIVSTGMIALIATHIAMSLICLAYDGSIFSSRHCGKNQLYFILDYINLHGQFSIPAGIFIMLFERYGSVLFPVFRLTFKYKLCFFALLLAYMAGSVCFIHLLRFSFSGTSQLFGQAMLTLLYILSFFFVIHLHFVSRKQYYRTIGEIPLEQRYLLSESNELCQKCCIPTLCLLTINTSLFVSFWLFVMAVIPFEFMYQYFLVYGVVLNISATIFPVLFLIGFKQNRRRTGKRNGTVHAAEVRQLNGNRINTTQTQEEYFQQLQNSWS